MCWRTSSLVVLALAGCTGSTATCPPSEESCNTDDSGDSGPPEKTNTTVIKYTAADVFTADVDESSTRTPDEQSLGFNHGPIKVWFYLHDGRPHRIRVLGHAPEEVCKQVSVRLVNFLHRPEVKGFGTFGVFDLYPTPNNEPEFETHATSLINELIDMQGADLAMFKVEQHNSAELTLDTALDIENIRTTLTDDVDGTIIKGHRNSDIGPAFVKLPHFEIALSEIGVPNTTVQLVSVPLTIFLEVERAYIAHHRAQLRLDIKDKMKLFKNREIISGAGACAQDMKSATTAALEAAIEQDQLRSRASELQLLVGGKWLTCEDRGKQACKPTEATDVSEQLATALNNLNKSPACLKLQPMTPEEMKFFDSIDATPKSQLQKDVTRTEKNLTQEQKKATKYQPGAAADFGALASLDAMLRGWPLPPVSEDLIQAEEVALKSIEKFWAARNFEYIQDDIFFHLEPSAPGKLTVTPIQVVIGDYSLLVTKDEVKVLEG